VDLPGIERAVVDSAKLRDYLLAPSHPIGRFKATFFASLGYTQEEWEILSADLKQHAKTGDIREGDASPYGQKFEVRGRPSGPAGREAQVVAVWIVLRDEDFPRFITAFPG